MKISPELRPARVFVIEDHLFLRKGLGAFVGEQPQLEYCGESSSSDDAVFGTLPDLVLLGSSREDPAGVNTIAELQSGGITAKFIVLADRQVAARASMALRRGARGFLTKAEAPETLLDAIGTVLAGEVFVCNSLKSKLVERIVFGSGDSESMLDQLTYREIGVLELIGAGLTTTEIAKQLSLSSKTVDVHRSNIKKKLRFSNVNELICFAAQNLG